MADNLSAVCHLFYNVFIMLLNLIVGNNRFQSIFGSIDHNSMIMTEYDNQNFHLDPDFGVD